MLLLRIPSISTDRCGEKVGKPAHESAPKHEDFRRLERPVRLLAIFLVPVLLLFPVLVVKAKSEIDVAQDAYINKVRSLTFEIAKRSFPEIDTAKIRFETFKSNSTFFKARFSIGRFVTFQPSRYIFYINPSAEAKGIGDEALAGVIAHELAHIRYYTSKNRIELLGLGALLCSGFRTRFERRADLRAIERGYGEQIIAYRKWIYGIISAKARRSKKRFYLTPDEIRIVIDEAMPDPVKMRRLKRDVPEDIDELRREIRGE